MAKAEIKIFIDKKMKEKINSLTLENKHLKEKIEQLQAEAK